MKKMIKEKILIVEDERSISNFMSTILTTNGYDVIISENGANAYTMITSHCPDLIILDLGLPDVDGLEIIRSVREWSQLPILVVRSIKSIKLMRPTHILVLREPIIVPLSSISAIRIYLYARKMAAQVFA